MCCPEIRKSAFARHLFCRRPFPLRLFFLRLFFLFSLTSAFSAPARAETSRAVGYLLLPAEFYAIDPDSSFIDMRTGSGTVTMHLNTELDDLPGSAKSTLLLFSSSDAETLTVEGIEFHRRGRQDPDEDDIYDVSVSYTIHKKGEVSLVLRSFFSEDPADFPRAWLGNEEASLVRRYEQNDWGWEEWSWEAVSWDISSSEDEEDPVPIPVEDEASEYVEDDEPDPVEDEAPEYVEDEAPDPVEDETPEYAGDDAPGFVEEEGSAPVEDGDPGFEEGKGPSPVAGGIFAPRAAEDSLSGDAGTRDDAVDGTLDPVKGKAPGSGSSTAVKAGSIASDLLEGIPNPDPGQDIPQGSLPGVTDPDTAAQTQASQAQASQAQAMRSQTRQAAQTQVREAQTQVREAQTQVREAQTHDAQSREAQPQAGQPQKVGTQTARTQAAQADQGTQNPGQPVGQPVRADQNVKALPAYKIAAKTAPQTAQEEKRTVSKNSNDIPKLQNLTAAACLLFVLLGVFRAHRTYLRSLRQGEQRK